MIVALATYCIEGQGVTITLPPTTKAPSTTRQLSFAEVAALTDYDALALGLPLYMQAVIVLRIDGRIDAPDFAITHSVEPFNHMHSWTMYRREGAFILVGARVMRLNPIQLCVLELLDAMRAADGDVAQRLFLWEQLLSPLHAGKQSHVLVQNDLPNIRLSIMDTLPLQAMTRAGKILKTVAKAPEARWAMGAGRRYYIRPSA